MTATAVTLSHYHNSASRRETPYPEHCRRIFSLEQARLAFDEISQWPNYRATPLHRLPALARDLGVAQVYYKDESVRFELKSFKALGGAFAVARQLRQHIRRHTGVDATLDDLLAKRFPEQTEALVFSCATDGNHGRSVAWGCRMFGCKCIIYIHRDVSAGREQAMRHYGAEVIRIAGNYDDSIKTAAHEAAANDRIIVSDTSYPGYVDIPRDVMLGYSVMLAEAVEQLRGEIPSHVFIQGGVGGLAAAVCAYFWETWGSRRPRFIVVEPEAANCLQQSARAGQPVTVDGDLDTLMAGLACGEVSQLAWEVLAVGADDFMTVSEGAVAPCMSMLAAGDPAIEAGESAVAGLAAALALRDDTGLGAALGLDADSRIFVIGTEGATDPDVYRQLVNAQ